MVISENCHEVMQKIIGPVNMTPEEESKRLLKMQNKMRDLYIPRDTAINMRYNFTS